MSLIDLHRDARRKRHVSEERLAERLALVTDLDRDRRCRDPIDNLVPAVLDRWAEISEQLGGGDGGELQATGDRRPKFCSAYSSCALAVNSFGVFAGAGAGAPALALPGVGRFAGPVAFEAQRSAGTRGYKPNLDVVAEPEHGDWLFVESKCLEYLRFHAMAFSAAYVARAHELLSAPTAAAYARFASGQDGSRLLDAPQLLKHFLAAKVAAAGRRRVILAYIYWEPEDAGRLPLFATHREEAQRLAAMLIDDDVRLVTLSYPQLWASWERLGDPALSAHVATLRARYAITL